MISGIVNFKFWFKYFTEILNTTQYVNLVSIFSVCTILVVVVNSSISNEISSVCQFWMLCRNRKLTRNSAAAETAFKRIILLLVLKLTILIIVLVVKVVAAEGNHRFYNIRFNRFNRFIHVRDAGELPQNWYLRLNVASFIPIIW